MREPIQAGSKKSTLTPAQVKSEAASVSAKAALTSAANTAKKSPTPANVAAVKKAFTAAQAAPSLASTAAKTPIANLSKISADNDASMATLNATIAEAETAAKAAETAVAEANALASVGAKKPLPAVGTILRYDVGATPGSRIPVYADGVGGEFKGEEVNNPVNPGSTGFEDTGVVTLASNTFANTLALLMGETEASQPWVEELRQISQGFINTGSSVEEAMNLALRDAKAQGKASKFVQRFDAIFKLQDRLNAGETVQVPSIADYVKAEQQLGDVFRTVNLPELATKEIASKIFGDANKSVSEATAIIQDVFGAIDNAPAALKADLQTIAPGADRTAIAKALLLGKDGILELTKKVANMSQISAAKTQGVTINTATAEDLVAGGANYGTSLGKFETVKQLERGQQLGRMSNIDFTQQEAIASAFQSSASANEKIRKINEEEANRFSGRSGYLPSQNRSKDF